jgi:hypothetical protein
MGSGCRADVERRKLFFFLFVRLPHSTDRKGNRESTLCIGEAHTCELLPATAPAIMGGEHCSVCLVNFYNVLKVDTG